MMLTARKTSSEPCRTAPFCANIAIIADACARASIFAFILPLPGAAVNAAAGRCAACRSSALAGIPAETAPVHTAASPVSAEPFLDSAGSRPRLTQN